MPTPDKMDGQDSVEVPEKVFDNHAQDRRRVKKQRWLVTISACCVGVTAVWFFFGFLNTYLAFLGGASNKDLYPLEFGAARLSQVLLILSCIFAFVSLLLMARRSPVQGHKALWLAAAPLMVIGMFQLTEALLDLLTTNWVFEHTRDRFDGYHIIWPTLFLGMWTASAVLQLAGTIVVGRAGAKGAVLRYAALACTVLLVVLVGYLQCSMLLGSAPALREPLFILCYFLEMLIAALLAFSNTMVAKLLG
ncbi:MAG: hypothetical protein LBR58_06395 [Propionibacteriaceae bacterium]|jgi:hypothetical protein|nr:hypothetical protein [Propionibacteriaceae bacterium]